MWTARADRSSWFAEQVRQKTISQLTMRLNGSIPIIQSLVALCPLLGLMGTIPTMAGMVGALSGVFAATWLTRMVKSERTHLEDALIICWTLYLSC